MNRSTTGTSSVLGTPEPRSEGDDVDAGRSRPGRMNGGPLMSAPTTSTNVAPATGRTAAERPTATREAPGRPAPGRRIRTWLWPERYRPWRGRATRTDMILMGAFLGVVVLGFAVKPAKPFLLASHPVALEFLTGDPLAIGAAAAFARIGEAPLWLVVIAGAVGMAKFDWLTWWAGRQWGEGIIRMFTTREQARRYAELATRVNPWIVRVAVVAAVLPGIPAAIVYAAAGMAGMRPAAFVGLNVVGASLITGLVVGLGYGVGQSAVDLVLLIDRYALLVSLTLIGATFLVPWLRRRLRGRRGHATAPEAPSRHPAQVG